MKRDRMAPTRLPFTIIDETFVHADDPSEPVTVHIEARVAGPLDGRRLRDAVGRALARHPLARARLEPWTDDAVGYEWIVDEEPQVDPVRTESVGRDVDLDRLRSELSSVPLNLFESPPLRVRHLAHPDGDVVMVSIHHSASDGMGALRLLQSILRGYADVDDPMPDIDPAEARRLVVPAAPPSLDEQLHSGRMELQRLTRLTALPARLTPDGETTRPGYGFRTLRVPLAPIVSAPLREVTGATVNDLLIAAASLAAGRWIEEHGAAAGRVAVQMPINARPAAWSRETVANLVTGDSVSTSAAERADPAHCLTAVAGWTEAVKKRGPGPALAALDRMPRFAVAGRRAATKWARRNTGRLAETLVLSNLGRIPDDFVVGDGAGPTEVVFSPPAPMPYGLGIGAVALGDELVLALRHRWTLWSTAADDRFATILREELDRLTSR
jgi:NRPS condensation-like uncharacterized protein